MLTKKNTIIVFSIITIINGLLYALVLFGNIVNNPKWDECLKTLFSGISISGMVTLGVSIIDYIIERKKAIENFIKNFYKIYENILALPYSTEEELKNNLCKFSWALQKYKNLIKTLYNNNLSTLFANLNFLFLSKSKKNTLFYCSYNKLEQLHHKLLELNYHIEQYNNIIANSTSGNKIGIIKSIMDIQSSIFELLQKEDITVVKNSFAFNLYLNGCDILKFLYGKKYKVQSLSEEDFISVF